ncbi:MAG: hypothetical protein B6244_08120 [Candidatus Cloacimonetes bacterium 4572_55]|nr:MAG: hypothetical protein B6244_08120 [Candidatus Cloacimonetes bacterium 4572_55]
MKEKSLSFQEYFEKAVFSPSLHIEEAIIRFKRNLKLLFQIDSFAFLGPDPDDWQSEFVFDFDSDILEQGLPVWAESLIAQAANEKHPCYCFDAENGTDTPWREIFEKSGYRTLVFFPVQTVTNLEGKLKSHSAILQNAIVNINFYEADRLSDQKLKVLYSMVHLFCNQILANMLFSLSSNYASSVIENLPVDFFTITRKGIHFSNVTSRTSLGLDHIDRDKTYHLSAFFPEAEKTGLDTAIDRIFNRESELENLEFWYEKPSGGRILVNVKVSFLDSIEEGYQLLFGKAQRQDVDTAIMLVEDVTLQRERRRLAQEMELAHEVQMGLLPGEAPQVEGLEIATLALPAMHVGGDYFDIIRQKNGGVVFIIADVSGKGVPAAFRMAELKGVFQTLSRLRRSPKRILTEANEIIYEEWDPKQFVSLAYAVVDIKWNSMELCRAGHEPILLIREGRLTRLEPSGIALGLTKEHLFEAKLDERRYRLFKGDKLVFYTDGLTESTNRSDEPYGEERLYDLLGAISDQSPSDIIQRIRSDLKEFIGDRTQFDDITVIVVEVGD